MTNIYRTRKPFTPGNVVFSQRIEKTTLKPN